MSRSVTTVVMFDSFIIGTVSTAVALLFRLLTCVSTSVVAEFAAALILWLVATAIATAKSRLVSAAPSSTVLWCGLHSSARSEQEHT